MVAIIAPRKALSWKRSSGTSAALRIGAFEPPGSPSIATARDLSAWLSPRDGAQLFACAIEAEVEGFFVGHGISDNRFKRFDLAETRRVLGYAPQDDAFQTFDVAQVLGG